MKTRSILTILALLRCFGSVFAQLTIPSDDSDGACNPVASVEIDLSQANTGTWSDNNSANAGKVSMTRRNGPSFSSMRQ